MRSDDEPIRVVYMGGWSYSGSTLLGNVLGEAEGFFAAGEVRYVWRRGLIEDRLCGCGVPFSRCPVWSRVVEEAFGGRGGVEAERLASLEEGLFLHRRAPRFVVGHVDGPELRLYAKATAAVYGALRAVTGCRIIVDTSKSPLLAALLRRSAALDVRFVHLVRDPRGNLFSHERRARNLSPLLMLPLWNVTQLAAELGFRDHSGRYLRVRYEDFARSPDTVAASLARFAGEPDIRLPFAAPRAVTLRPNHNLSGNENRFVSGRVEIGIDERWRTELPAHLRVLATVLTWPLLARYGYLRAA